MDPNETPGERLLYALGQLYRMSRRGELAVPPRQFDVLGLARIIGVARDIEFVSECEQGIAVHFPSEVLVLTEAEFPWALHDLDTFAMLEETAALNGPTD